MITRGSNGDIYADTETSELVKAIEKVNDCEARVQLLMDLNNKGLCTRDVYSFANKQASLRSVTKNLHKPTIREAMSAKISDSRQALKMHRIRLKAAKAWLLDKLGGRRFKLRKLVKMVRSNALQKTLKTERKNKKKIEHCEKTQTVHKADNSKKVKHFKASTVHSRLREYEELPIFGSPNDLPVREKSHGPFICSPLINLDSNERVLLNRDPKYSLMQKVQPAEFNTEIDRGLCKHRYGKMEEMLQKKKLRVNKLTQPEQTREYTPMVQIKDDKITLTQNSNWNKAKQRLMMQEC